MTITWFAVSKHNKDLKAVQKVFYNICEFMISYFVGPSSDTIEVTEDEMRDFLDYLHTYKHHFFDEDEFSSLVSFAIEMLSSFKWDS